MKEKNNRGKFASKIGVILASAGSAVGLGNIWRFPTETGENGGAAFILLYIGCILLLGLPVMISEFLIGRRTHADASTAFELLAPKHKQWHWVGRLGVLSGIMIFSFYSVVAGWTVNYTVQAALNRFNQMVQTGEGNVYSTYFNSFVSDPLMPTLYLVLFILLTHFVVARGIEKGIERFSKLMMPTLFLLLLVLAGFALTTEGAGEGLRFLFKPDFSKIDSSVVLSAMGQAFFSLSIGLGCLCTYASYFRKEVNLVRTAGSVAGIDTFVAIISGLIIFPAVYSVAGMEPSEGPSLVFVALPNIFHIAFSEFPVLAYVLPFLFYFLLILASLTSTISMHELITAYFHEAHHLSRKKATYLVTGISLFLGILCSLSLGIGSSYTIGGMTLFDLFDYLTAKWMLPLGGLFTVLFTGWYLDRRLVYAEVSNEGSLKVRFFRAYIFLVRYVAPIAIAGVFLKEWGLF